MAESQEPRYRDKKNLFISMGGYIFPMPYKHSTIKLFYGLQAIIYYLAALLTPAILIYGLYYWIPFTGCHSLKGIWTGFTVKNILCFLQLWKHKQFFLATHILSFSPSFLRCLLSFLLYLCSAQYFIPCIFRNVRIYFPGNKLKNIYIVCNVDMVYICPGQATSPVST